MAKKKKQVDLAAKEVALAWKRINGTAARRLRWLLNFSEMNLDAISQGRFDDLRWELVAFGIGRKPPETSFDMFFELLPLTLPPEAMILEEAKHPPKSEEEHEERQRAAKAEMAKGMHPQMVRDFQAVMKKAFDTLFAGEWWEVKRPTAVQRIALTHIKRKDGSWRAQNPPALMGPDLLLIQAIDLISAEKDRLLICANPKCKLRFVAEKAGRARFHSPKCSAIVRVHKARGKM